MSNQRRNYATQVKDSINTRIYRAKNGNSSKELHRNGVVLPEVHSKFSSIARLLHEPTKKNQPSRWEEVEQKAFEELKKRIGTAPVLILPDPSLPYIAITDASQNALGVALMQNKGEGNRSIAFVNRKLTEAESKLGAYERELAGMTYALSQ